MTEIQLDIIRTFGSKELNQGCLIKIENDYFHLMEKYEKGTSYRGFEIPIGSKMLYVTDTEIEYNKNIEILGHIPELFPDVARATEGTDIDIWMDTYTKELIASGDSIGHNIIPYNPTLSLLDQEEEALASLLNLFK